MRAEKEEGAEERRRCLQRATTRDDVYDAEIKRETYKPIVCVPPAVGFGSGGQ